MKKLEFTFKNGNEIIAREVVEYFIEDNTLSFSVKENIFEITFGERFKFIKRDNNTVFEIIKNTGKTECHYELLENNVVVDINLNYFECIKIENGFTLIYMLESDLDNKKEINITFLSKC